MVNINIDIPDELHQEAKQEAVLRMITLKQYFINCIKYYLEKNAVVKTANNFLKEKKEVK